MATPPETEDQKWANSQRHLTNVSTGLTAAGAAALGAMLGGKTKAGKKILPKALHKKLKTGKADDVRNSIALASMVGGVASGAHWSKKLKSDAKKPPEQPKVIVVPQDAAVNYAKAMHIEKGVVTATVRNGVRGAQYSVRSGYRKPKRLWLKGVTR